MKLNRRPPINITLRSHDHPYLQGPWTPVQEELDAYDLPVIEGRIPADLDGVYLRNTENQIHEPLGRFHPFDGDGMIHQIDFRAGTASYRNRWVRTRCFRAEQEERRSLWGGLMDPYGTSVRPGFGAHGGLKDAASTDVVVHRGVALATHYQCGEAYCLDPETLEPLGIAPWVPLDGTSAHAKVDERTGELLFFNFSKHAPYMHYGVVNRDGRLQTYFPVSLPGPRLPHDMAITEHYSILNDLPLFWERALWPLNIHLVRFHDDVPSRFAIVPRHGRTEDIRWFEAAPTFVLHYLNAYEDGDEIILDGYFQENPLPDPLQSAPRGLGRMMAFIDQHSFRSKLHRWRFDLKTGKTREERLDDCVVEFGVINQRHAGRRHRYVYSATGEPGWFLLNGFVKHDLLTGRSWHVPLEKGRFCSEAPFAPRVDAKDEDDGYLVSFITDERSGTSECVLIDAQRFEDGPMCRIALPHKICSGTHACWASRPFA
jgi:carotenoid cleavage dioxygenase-like enzyme